MNIISIFNFLSTPRMPDVLERCVWCEGVTRLVSERGAVHVAARVSTPGISSTRVMTGVTCPATVSAPHVQVDIVTGGRKLQKYL